MIEKVFVTGKKPDAIIYDSYSHYVFIFNGGGKNATVLDAAPDKIISTIELSGKPEFAVSDGEGNIFVNIEDKSMIKVINATSLKVEHEWPITPGEEPSGLAIDLTNKRLFTVCDNGKMVILDSQSGKLLNLFRSVIMWMALYLILILCVLTVLMVTALLPLFRKKIRTLLKYWKMLLQKKEPEQLP